MALGLLVTGERSIFLPMAEILEAARLTHDIPDDATIFDGACNGYGFWLVLNSDKWGPLTQAERARGDYHIKPRSGIPFCPGGEQ